MILNTNNKPDKSKPPRHSSERSHALNAELVEMMVLSRLPSLENRDLWAISLGEVVMYWVMTWAFQKQ